MVTFTILKYTLLFRRIQMDKRMHDKEDTQYRKSGNIRIKKFCSLNFHDGKIRRKRHYENLTLRKFLTTIQLPVLVRLRSMFSRVGRLQY